MGLFAQSLKTNVKDWFRGLVVGSIPDIDRFYAIFLEKWEEKKNFVQMLTTYNQLKRGTDESIKTLHIDSIQSTTHYLQTANLLRGWPSCTFQNLLMMSLPYF